MNTNYQNNQESSEESAQSLLTRRAKRGRWTYPFLYLALTAVVLTVFVWGQNADHREQQLEKITNESISKNFLKNETSGTAAQLSESVKVEVATPMTLRENKELAPVIAPTEKMQKPFADGQAISLQVGFYNAQGNEGEQAAALVKFDNSYWPHTGVDYTEKDGKQFEVLAAMSGKVVKVEKSPTVGEVVEIEHSPTLKTIYQSLEQIKVKVGDTVKSRDLIAYSGRNLFEKDLGNHLHFEVHHKGKPISPEEALKSQLGSGLNY
jgi:stage II sporulation protein Q